jgi:hypothetical protein
MMSVDQHVQYADRVVAKDIGAIKHAVITAFLETGSTGTA